MSITALHVKHVQFNDDELLGIQYENQIYTVVRRVCECVGFTDGQTRRQVENISNDLVLKQGVANLRIPTKGGNQATLCLMIDFLPLWLAKISITPKMQENNPELVEKLIAYQLKAKDVLAAAFLPQQLIQSNQLTSCHPILEQSIYHLQQSHQFTVNTLMEQAYELGSVKDQLTIAKKEIKALKSQASRTERKLKNHIDNKPVITYFGDLQALHDDMSENYQSFVNCHTIQDAENNIIVECKSIFRVVELDKDRLIFRATKYKPTRMCVLNVDRAERIDNWDGNKYVSKYRLFTRDGESPIEFEAVIKR